ncbi:MAG TPA: hypothetical protein VMX58_10645 [Patescibacteria group bacterium]|nr:hypothetical protein [Patescibacteria group bacterium]
MVKRYLFFMVATLLVFSGCVLVRTVTKDIPIEQMDVLGEKYIGRTAWTRALLVDLDHSDSIIDRDAKVEIIGIDMHWGGAVTVRGPDRKKITHGLYLKRPLTSEKYEEKLSQIFWFKKPEYRYRMDLRRYGKRTAKAIFNHELFKGMKRDAALDSWGYPDEMKENELGGVLNEQWILLDPRQNKKRYVWLVDGAVDKWEE